MALAHKIPRDCLHTLLKTGQVYQERGVVVFDDSQKERSLARMQRRIEKLGCGTRTDLSSCHDRATRNRIFVLEKIDSTDQPDY
ncbi:MAG: hypothetical protein U0Z44_21585 [Kouleothrix sp.]